MMNLVIGIGVVLVMAILYMIFRVTTLVNVVKGEEGKVVSHNGINALLFPVFCVSSLILFFWYSYAHFDRYVMPVASEHGKITDSLFWITMGICVVAFVIISLAMFWFTYKYQYDKNRKAEFFAD